MLLAVVFSLVVLQCASQVPLAINEWKGKKVMFITAHPDDVEGFAGGTMATIQEQGGVETAYLIVTSGNAGGLCYNTTAHFECDPDTNKETLALLRRQESLAAARFLGVHTVYRMGKDDGLALSYHETELRRAIVAYVRTFKPDIVFTSFPQPNFQIPPTCNGKCSGMFARWNDLGFHPDHQHVGKVVFSALYGSGSAVGNDKVFPDIASPPWQPSQLYFFALTTSAQQSITHYTALTESTVTAKTEALLLHKSQFPVPASSVREGVTWVAEQVAAQLTGVKYAEGFQAFF
mmetsp:Transcript_29980/g.58749  ORF Transcript_29980/g.58749 Transcript_29980/m.58749 type:complete len:291 (+) Transcript_29980:36-908(+)|eukprot:CAMPEP_0175145910 /NCGR_PEP_ID=MMETSP0087-20121206/15061_1 /TAXON_ID=136419 /ORGANISM="Unknown Unknown, Strain D1" /LENGTH=290 /DNA_ID=CAMNT_0016430765 /DNA_START=34 /DNA_END=906 /DNA_ORIENTATION=+